MNHHNCFKEEIVLRLFLFLFLALVPNIFYYILLREMRIGIAINNLLLITLSLLFLKQTVTKIPAYLLLFLFVINNGLEIFSLYFYNGSFNVGMALNFLSTNKSESLEMSRGYWFVFLIAIIYYMSICFSVNLIKSYAPNRLLIIFCLLLAIRPIYLVHNQIIYFRSTALYNKAGESNLYLYLLPTPVNTFGPFLEAHHYLKIVEKTSIQDFQYPPFTVTKNNIQNIVVVLGESARRDALNIYGNTEPTSSLIESKISNLLIYNNAIAPAEFTNLALSFILSKQVPNASFSITKNEDNVVSLANSTNIWETYWISNQEKTGTYVNLFANIDLKAKYKYWTKPGSYDEAILLFMDKVLRDGKTKRLIFVHLMGSHPEVWQRYPKSFNRFHSDKQEFKNEYKNSIAYTDHVLDEIIKRMEGSSSIVIYLSDHAQSIEDGAYRHSYTKKGVEVPFFIWHSDSVEDGFKKSGRVNDYISTTNLYNILSNFMGIHGLLPKNPNDSLKVMDGSLKTSNYNDLKPGM